MPRLPALKYGTDARHPKYLQPRTKLRKREIHWKKIGITEVRVLVISHSSFDWFRLLGGQEQMDRRDSWECSPLTPVLGDGEQVIHDDQSTPSRL